MTVQVETIEWGAEQLLLVPTDTKMAEVLEEATRMQRKYPEILRRIEQDQIAYGKKKKLPRVQDRRWEEAQTLPLPMEDLLRDGKDDLRAADLELADGRPRLPAVVVYLPAGRQASFCVFGDATVRSARKAVGIALSIR